MLFGGIDVTSTGGTSTGSGFMPMTVDVPIVLGAANSWSLGASILLTLSKGITGDQALAIELLGPGTNLQVAAPIETGPVRITGSSTTGLTLADTDGADLNGTNGQPVALSGLNLDAPANVGPLTFSGAYLTLRYGALRVNGPVTLTKGSTVLFDLPRPRPDGQPPSPPSGASPQITAAGAAILGSATLQIAEECAPTGTVLTLVQAQGGISGVFTDPSGGPVTNGQTIEPATNACSHASSAAPLRIDYSTNAVTATVLSPAASQAGNGSPVTLAPPEALRTYRDPHSGSANALQAGLMHFSRTYGRSRICRLLSRHRAILSFFGLEPGRLEADLTDPPTGAQRGSVGTPASVTVARATQEVDASGKARLTLTPTRGGKQLLRRARRRHRDLDLNLQAVLTPASGPQISRNLPLKARS
jgi:hypothetical protein